MISIIVLTTLSLAGLVASAVQLRFLVRKRALTEPGSPARTLVDGYLVQTGLAAAAYAVAEIYALVTGDAMLETAWNWTLFTDGTTRQIVSSYSVIALVGLFVVASFMRWRTWRRLEPPAGDILP